MTEGPRPASPFSTRTGQLAYYASAVVAALVFGFDLPFPLDIIVLVAIGLVATWIRYRTAGRDSFWSSISWLGVFVAVWLPIAWLRGTFPFG